MKHIKSKTQILLIFTIVLFIIISCKKEESKYPIILELNKIEKEEFKAYFIKDTTDANDKILNADSYTYENIDTNNLFNGFVIEKIIFNSNSSASFIFNESPYKGSYDILCKNMEVHYEHDIIKFIHYNPLSEGFDTTNTIGNKSRITFEGIFATSDLLIFMDYKKMTIEDIKNYIYGDVFESINDTLKFYNFKLIYNLNQ